MSNIDDGGPAFPRASAATPSGIVVDTGAPGMSLRDWFAGQALAGDLAAMGSTDTRLFQLRMKVAEIEGVTMAAVCAGEAYVQADAMLAAREREEEAK